MAETTDPRIYGWIEMQTSSEQWGAWRKVQRYLTRPHPILFYLLFGVGDGGLGWRPVAPGRGIPDGLSDVALRSGRLFGSESFGQTWIRLSELEEARQQCSAEWDDRIHRYEAYESLSTPKQLVWEGKPQRLVTTRPWSGDEQTLLDLGLPVISERRFRYIREPLEADFLLSTDWEWIQLLKDLRDQRAVYRDTRLVVAFQEF